MKKFYYLALVALVGIAFSSCSLLGGDKNPEYRLSDLQGLWEENGTKHYVRFTTEQSDEAGYLYGREWDEADDITEAELTPYGNGWFKYELKFADKQNKLTQVNMMEKNQAAIPQVYVVTILTGKRLEYYEKDHTNIKFYFSKVVVANN